MDEVHPGVFTDGDRFYTANQVAGETVYGEDLAVQDGVEYREWSPHRSKAAAALTKDIAAFPLERDDDVLYLGASTGTTVSHLSDICTGGMVYAVEYAPQVARQLVALSEQRENIAPLIADARTPHAYASLCSAADIIYQDVAQRDQAGILQRNADLFLKDGGHALLAIKAQSISSETPAGAVFDQVTEQLNETFDLVAGKKLAPFHTDHLFLVLRYPG
ncbi:MAG: fibrillarin-like rRNA/tRNA 2'-O-methyltransferase [Candidatus Nanohaloarchaea archaeon]|nr:fibrillarin-like rRNA/tRNA 2'-O-methyltransferase [Candidatus Nanohaloarchaea archaeon]